MKGSAPRRLGILGGSFDPPHLGHLHVARAARAELGLERVVLLPAAAPPHKRDRELASAEDRLEMVARLAALEPWFSVDRREIDRGGTSWTFETLTAMRAEQARGGDAPPTELCFLIGADSLLDLPGWHRAAELVTLATFVTVPRAGVELPAIAAQLRARLPTAADALLARVLRVAPLAISSSEVRERCRAGRPIDDLVPAAVAEWIARRGLYRGER